MTNKIGMVVAIVIVLVMAIALSLFISAKLIPMEKKDTEMIEVGVGERIKLPEPRYKSNISVEEALLERRSIRDYSGENLTIEEVSQLLWAAQGITADWGGRTAPSAGPTYPLEFYVVVGNVNNLSEGVYKYKPEEHELEKVRDGDMREELAKAGGEFMGVIILQRCIKNAAIDIVFTAIYEQTTGRYSGDRGIRYVHMEAGHAAQNVYLQAVTLDLGTVVIGAFDDSEVKEIINAEANEDPLYIMPVGRKKKSSS